MAGSLAAIPAGFRRGPAVNLWLGYARLLDATASAVGEAAIIARAGRPVARLVPIAAPSAKRRLDLRGGDAASVQQTAPLHRGIRLC